MVKIGLSTILVILSLSIFSIVLVYEYRTHTGWYVGLFDIYIVRANIPIESMKIVSSHEIGHDVWYDRINKSLREEYKLIYEKYSNHTNKHCNSRDNVVEEFAESFMYYDYHNLDFWPCREKFQFFSKLDWMIE